MSNAIMGPLDDPTSPDGSQNNVPGIGIGMPDGGSARLDPTAVKSAIIEAIELGYRHFQAAISSVFEHVAIGEAIAEALERGLVRRREDLFITCKIEYRDDATGYDFAIGDLKKFIEKLHLEYVDLYLIESPDCAEPGDDETERANNEIPLADLMSMWSAMEECQKLGLTKSIGLCNFSSKLLENLIKHAKIPPSINQVTIQRLLREKEVREICLANKISIIASCTIGEKEKHFISNQFMEFDFLNAIAKHGHTTAELVVIRWAYEQGATLLLESLDKEHMQEIMNLK